MTLLLAILLAITCDPITCYYLLLLGESVRKDAVLEPIHKMDGLKRGQGRKESGWMILKQPGFLAWRTPMTRVKNKLFPITLCDLYAWRKQFMQSAVGLLWIVLLVGCNAGSENNGYEIINTGISAGGCWYDTTRFVIFKGEQPPGTLNFVVEGLYYLDIANPHELKKIDLAPLEPSLQTQIRGIVCQDNKILFDTPGVGGGMSRVYVLTIGERPELIVEMRGASRIAVSLKGQYILGNSRKVISEPGPLQGVYEGNDDCPTAYLKTGFKLLCWDSWLERRWPLSKFVLSEYLWAETIKVRGSDGKGNFIPNPVKPLLGKDGKRLKHDLLLRDFENQILLSLHSDPIYGIAGYPSFNPDESYAYSGCRKWGQKNGSGLDRVCRYQIDGKIHQWEEIFALDEGHSDHIGIESLNISFKGDIFFVVPGNTKFRGIWMFSSAKRTIIQVTRPPAYHNDTFPQISPDGVRVAFIRPDKSHATLFIAQRSVRGETK